MAKKAQKSQNPPQAEARIPDEKLHLESELPDLPIEFTPKDEFNSGVHDGVEYLYDIEAYTEALADRVRRRKLKWQHENDDKYRKSLKKYWKKKTQLRKKLKPKKRFNRKKSKSKRGRKPKKKDSLWE